MQMKISRWFVVMTFCAIFATHLSLAEPAAGTLCSRPQAGSIVEEPEDLRSLDGVLETNLTAYDAADADGSIRYCFTDAAGRQSPNLRVRPGDLVVLHLKNALTELRKDAPPAPHNHANPMTMGDSCSSGIMSAVSTNLHFHGLTIPPVCHQDDVMKTSVQPGDPPFEYRFRIPDDEPPGLYWYHPHIHGFSKEQRHRARKAGSRGSS